MIPKQPSLPRAPLLRRFLTSKGRVAFRHALESLHFSHNDVVLLPAYIGINDREGSGVLDPIRALHLKFAFYRVKRNLTVDLDDLSVQLDDDRIKALLLIHYFGIPQPDLQNIVEMCKERNIFVIEDCAHAFLSTFKGKRLGTYGDIGFYSLHKFLPLHDGGCMVITNNSLDDPAIPPCDCISHDSLALLHRFDYEAIKQTRIENYRHMASQLTGTHGVESLYHNLPEGAVPLNFPVSITHEKLNRQQVYHEMVEQNIEPVSLYYRIIPEIDKDRYPESYYVSDHIMNLPIHQDISYHDIDEIASTLKTILERAE